MKNTLIILSLVLLGACGPKLEGVYVDSLGIAEYEFRPSGKLYLRTLGTETELKYSLDGDKITIELPTGGNQVFTLLENGHLQGPLNIALEKKK